MSNEERVALLQKQLKATEELAKALMGVREAEANLARLMEHRGERRRRKQRRRED